MRISLIGTGYVGLVTGVCFAEVGHTCVCVDVDEAKVASINSGRSPIHEAGLEPLLQRVSDQQRLRATTDLRAAIADTDVTFIAVGTPFDGERIDLRFVTEAARQIGSVLRDKAQYHTVVVKSTVVPGTTDRIVRAALEEASGKRAGVDFGLGVNPEFLTEGVAVNDCLKPDRIVIGGIDARTIATLRCVYEPYFNAPIHETNNATAEMIKYTSNSVLATLISFSNEIANLCSAIGGIDVADVMKAVHTARYFTTVSADGHCTQAPITSFLWAGCGYGGSCLPKDTQALSAHGAAHGVAMPLLNAVIATNAQQPARMVALLDRHFPTLAGRRIALLGLAFKEDTDDMRESPAIRIAQLLLERGASVVGFDPVARSTARAALPKAVELADSLESALEGADAVLVVTRWREFLRVPDVLERFDAPVLVVDGRRVLSPSSVPRYEGIGR